jgi:ornithine decarboxylase
VQKVLPACFINKFVELYDMEKFISVTSAIESLKPNVPVHVFRRKSIREAYLKFTQNFAAKIMYAVKTNPSEQVIKELHSLGLNSYDVASINEIRRIRKTVPDAELFFMHTVKNRSAIREAYFEYNVRNFSLDSEEELQKILEETNNATDLTLFVRLAIPNSYAEINLAEKFGIEVQSAPNLLRKVKEVAKTIGICFHVGSQCMHPDAYKGAIKTAKTVIDKSKVKIDIIDVGGGFPSIYPGMHPPKLERFFKVIESEFAKLKKTNPELQLFCEPGRALVAESGSIIVRVEHRKGQNLYINDGTYGGLFDAGHPSFVFPSQLIRVTDAPVSNFLLPYSFYGPTCDSLDFMKGPFLLPENIVEGDYIEIGQMGAYGSTMVSDFNGFGDFIPVETADRPIMSMHESEEDFQLDLAIA